MVLAGRRALAVGFLLTAVTSAAVSALSLWRWGSWSHQHAQHRTGSSDLQVQAGADTRAPPPPNVWMADDQAHAQRRIVIVGGGLAGLSAALSAHAQLATSRDGGIDTARVLNTPIEIVVIDKMPKLGGNSAKASSGINAVNPAGDDTPTLFQDDTMRSGGGLSEPQLVETLVGRSQDAIHFLESYGIDLSKVTQLGGHSRPRSRSSMAGANVGWAIMSKVIGAVEKLPGVRVLAGHKLERVLVDAKGRVQGVALRVTHSTANLQQDEEVVLPAQAVILATGGFAANRSLLAAHAPHAAKLATTNGPWAQGDGLGVAQAAGAALEQLDQVQIHPTGFVDPADPTASTLFLAPERLRGMGALLLSRAGRRFVNELDQRDAVAAAVTSQPGRDAWLVLPEAGAVEYGLSAIQFYVSKGLMVKVEGGLAGLAKHLGVEPGVLDAEVAEHEAAAAGRRRDRWGKAVFPAPRLGEGGGGEAGVAYVARIAPVVHYTMGGVAMDARARALGPSRQPVPGLYVAGEVAAGVHGRNRLAGNSLLECVVFGMTAGREAQAYVALKQGAAVLK